LFKKLGALFLSLPVLAVGGNAVFAAATQSATHTPPSLTAPAPGHAALPGGCAGHDCANCPLTRAAAEQTMVKPAPGPEIRCGTD
jgi:hypothetical protein